MERQQSPREEASLRAESAVKVEKEGSAIASIAKEKAEANNKDTAREGAGEKNRADAAEEDDDVDDNDANAQVLRLRHG